MQGEGVQSHDEFTWEWNEALFVVLTSRHYFYAEPLLFTGTALLLTVN